ncbi:MAG: adenosylcobalamin-dependent ribonucleoside-diphosphate reductase, partial [Candidatus Cloacimonetes bacterium]|nr:adenosylcobalamin-dependent ribonucleoside-diphosphate reductase [Candidatus Cloacimonadota bacterium]
MKLSENALIVLEKRYFKKDNNGDILENWEKMITRVADNISNGNAEKKKRYYQLLDSGYFLPNSPTLMNAGNDLQQLSACFVLPLEDSMESIFECVKNAALIHKSGGGTGFSFSKLRQANARVRSTSGVSSGPITFLKVFNSATDAVKQGGTRRGANMAILNVDHPQILEFITCKENPNELTNFNLSVGITKKFMEAFYKDGEYELISPHTRKVAEKLKARDVFSLIIEMAYKNGEPGIIFLDRINKFNPTPHIGKIESTNPCFHPDTLISTNNGLKKIKEIYHNKEIEIYTDNRVIEEKVIRNNREYYKNGVTLRKAEVIKTGVKGTIRIDLKNGQMLKVTPEHKILTVKGWKEAKDLSQEDEVLVQSGKGCWSKTDNIGKELALFLGWMIGDGWLTSDGKVAGMVFAEKEKYILEKMQDIADKFGAGRGIINKRENNCWQMLFKRKDFVNIIKSTGLKAVKSPEKRIPLSMFSATKESVSLFINGLFSADGTVNHIDVDHRDIRLTSASFELLQDVQLLLLNEGIFSKIYDRTKKDQAKFSYTTINGEKKTYTSHRYYELIINGNDVCRFREFAGELIHKGKNEKLQKIDQNSRKTTKYISKIKEIVRAAEIEVYDIKEEVTHSLLANGIVAHNCGEQPLLPNEACNLGSLDLSAMIKNGKFDWTTLKKAVRDAVEFLDDVINRSKFPLPAIDEMAKSNRKIGLGIMGWADLLFLLKIPYNSKKATSLAEEVMEFIDYHSKQMSMELALKHNSFPNFKGSIYNTKKLNRENNKLDWSKLKSEIAEKGIRNATTTTIAPTGTISMICNTSSGIEPQFSLVYVKNVMDGEKLLYVNPHFEKAMRETGLYSKELMNRISESGSISNIPGIPENLRKVFVTSHDISPQWHIRMQAAFQKYTDNAVSKTINFKNEATKEDIRMAYELAYELGCKGVTVYRDGSRENQVLSVG